MTMRDERLNIQDAYEVVWNAGNQALLGNPNSSDSVRTIIADEMGRLFDKLDTAHAAAAVLGDQLPDGDTPILTVDSLIGELNNEKLRHFATMQERGVNPFTEPDDRLVAIVGLSIYVRAGHTQFSIKQLQADAE